MACLWWPRSRASVLRSSRRIVRAMEKPATPSTERVEAVVSALGPEPRTYRLNAIVDCPVPIVAAIQGACFGGGLEIAVACNLRIAAQGARFGAPVGRMGFPLALGETEGLFRLVGPSVSAELLIEGRLFDARTAREKGLVTRVVEAEDFEAAIAETVENICASGILAARSHKRQIRRLMRDAAPVTSAERMEVYGFAESDEYRRGVEAFLAKATRRAR